MPQQRKATVCPLGVMSVGGKWKMQIGYQLLSGAKRFGELQRLILGASRQMLSIQLRELEQMGLLHRQVYEQMPPKVEYSLTERCTSLRRDFYGPATHHTTSSRSGPCLVIVARGISVLFPLVEMLTLMGMCATSSNFVSCLRKLRTCFQQAERFYR